VGACHETLHRPLRHRAPLTLVAVMWTPLFWGIRWRGFGPELRRSGGCPSWMRSRWWEDWCMRTYRYLIPSGLLPPSTNLSLEVTAAPTIFRLRCLLWRSPASQGCSPLHHCSWASQSSLFLVIVLPLHIRHIQPVIA
jgi:hypothetical protein